MKYENVAEPFLDTVERYPDKTAVIFKRTELTYAEMNRQINALVHLLVDELGVEPGDKVAYLLPNSISILEVYYAIQKVGAVAVPLNFKLISREIAYLLEASGSSLLFFDLQFAAKVKEAEDLLRYPVGMLCMGGSLEGSFDVVSRLREMPTDEPVLFRDSSSLSRIQYTGGSTGIPKGAARTHAADLVELDGVLESNGMARRDDNVVLIQCPLEHHGGHSWFTSTFAAAATLVICDAFNPEKILYGIDRYKVTYIILLPPSSYLRLLDSPSLENYDLSSVRLVQSAAGSTTREIVRRIYECMPNAVLNYGWGQSESGLGSSLVLERSWLASDDRRLESIGKPMLHARMRIVDEAGREVPVGDTGEAIFASAAVMRGYYGQPELSEAAFTDDGWLRTGDMMMRDPDGYFYLRGRKKGMIKSGGENVFIGEVERVILSHPEVADCVVFGTDDAAMGEAVAAVVERKPGSHLGAADLQDHCKRYISSYKKPRYIVFVDHLDRDDAGKIRKQKVIDYFDAHKEMVAPRTFRTVDHHPETVGIVVPVPSSAFKQTNAFLVRGGERDLLVDTGICQEKSLEVLHDSLAALKVDMDRTDIFVTHLHAGHIGLASRIAAEGTRIFLGRADADSIADSGRPGYRECQIGRLSSWGLAADEAAAMNDANEAFWGVGARSGSDRFVPVDDGQMLEVGSLTVQVVATPGHTPGHCCLLLPETGTIFLGDHVLMSTSPNIVPWAGYTDIVESYLESLEKVYRLDNLRRGYCAHGLLADQPYPAARIIKRIQRLERHCRRRADEVVELILRSPGMDGMEIASKMTWNIPFARLEDASAMQRTVIVGETIAYIDHAVAQGRVEKVADGRVDRYFICGTR